jgi:uncharacterized protein
MTSLFAVLRVGTRGAAMMAAPLIAVVTSIMHIATDRPARAVRGVAADGSIKMMGCMLSLTLGAGGQASAQSEVEGRWKGALTVAGSSLDIVVTLKGRAEGMGGTIDIPQQGASALPLSNVSYQRPAVHFEIAGVPGAPTFNGAFTGDVIDGEFTQAGVAGTFHLDRDREFHAGAEETVAVPYAHEDVTFTNGDVRLAGTLTLPDGPGPHPAVVLISGSGPQNRDSELFGFRTFFVIADHLTRHGIAVLRYDDRGVGGSTGSVMASTSADFADDVSAAVDMLQDRPDIDPSHIGLLGHSEGGLVAVLAATRTSNVSFVVLLATPALPGADIMLAQGELIAHVNGAGEDAIQRQRAMQQRVFAAVRTGEGWDTIGALIAEEAREALTRMPPERRAALKDETAFVQAQVDAQLGFAQSTWFRYFLDYDPRPTLQKITVPVLGIFGELDLQVPADQNRDALQHALTAGGRTDYTIETLPRANHLFLTATNGSPAEYPTLEKAFVPELLPMVTSWISERSTP